MRQQKQQMIKAASQILQILESLDKMFTMLAEKKERVQKSRRYKND